MTPEQEERERALKAYIAEQLGSAGVPPPADYAEAPGPSVPMPADKYALRNRASWLDFDIARPTPNLPTEEDKLAALSSIRAEPPLPMMPSIETGELPPPEGSPAEEAAESPEESAAEGDEEPPPAPPYAQPADLPPLPLSGRVPTYLEQTTIESRRPRDAELAGMLDSSTRRLSPRELSMFTTGYQAKATPTAGQGMYGTQSWADYGAAHRPPPEQAATSLWSAYLAGQQGKDLGNVADPRGDVFRAWVQGARERPKAAGPKKVVKTQALKGGGALVIYEDGTNEIIGAGVPRTGGGGGGVAPAEPAEDVSDVIMRTYERAGVDAPAGLLQRARGLDAVPLKQRSARRDQILRDMDADIAARGKAEATATQEEKASRVPGWERTADAPKMPPAEMTKRRDAAASLEKMRAIASRVEAIDSELSAADRMKGMAGIDTPLTAEQMQLQKAATTELRILANMGVPSLSEMAVVNAQAPELTTIRGWINGAVRFRSMVDAMERGMDAEMGARGYRRAGAGGAKPAGNGQSGKLRVPGGTATDTPANRAKLEQRGIAFEVI